MPSRRQQRRSLAIAWMTMIVAACLAHARDDIADLFADARAKPGYDHVGNRRSNVPSDKRILENSLSSLSGPEILEDAESFADPESKAPHPRFKRIADPMDAPPQRSHRMPRPHLAARRRSARRMFRRFALEESNPADESEAEYASVYDDDVDLPEASLNDELTKKRNRFEDVYPEVSPKSQQSPPDFLKRPVDVDDMIRKKRDRDEEEEQQEEADCADGAHEEYYYEDEAPEVSRRENNKRASQSGVEYIDEEQRMDKRNSDSPFSQSAVNANSRSVDKNSEVSLTANIPNPLTSGKVVRSSVKEKSQLKASNTNTKISAAKSSSNLVKRTSQRKPTKEKKRPKPKAKPKPNPKPKPKPRPKKPKPRKKPKSITGAQSAKLSSDCCENFERASDADRYKRDKTLIIKAVPKGENVNELQIYQKADDAKKKAVSKATEKQSSAEDRTALSISEVKGLLGKLMVKIDNLRDLVSELRNNGGDAHIEDSN